MVDTDADAAQMLKGDDYPSPERGAMDMSSALANQAAAEAVAAAITEAAAAEREREREREREQEGGGGGAGGEEVGVDVGVDVGVGVVEHHHEHQDHHDEHSVPVDVVNVPVDVPVDVPEAHVPVDVPVDVNSAINNLPMDASSLPSTLPVLPSAPLSSLPAETPRQQTYRPRAPPPFQFSAPHRQAPDSPLTNSQQLAILREFYARNPNPGKRDYEILAEKTGRPWNKIREYFRQRRNKLRGLVDLEVMEEPGRATGWLQVTYRPGPPHATVSQLALYNAYKTRFDPYAMSSPLLAGQELIQLACATFPGCEMARDDGDYVLRGLRDREGAANDSEWDRDVDALVEPLRGATWLLSQYQHQADPAAPPSVSQTELYSAYAARFSTLLPDADAAQAQADADAEAEAELKEFEANMAADDDMDDINSFLPPAPEDHSETHTHTHTHTQAHTREHTAQGTPDPPPARENRLLNPVELITLVKMTFPKSEAAVDTDGRFIIRGLERREGIEKGRAGIKAHDMFPFALASHPPPSDPSHPFTSLLKRKLALLAPEPDADEPGKRRATSIGVNIPMAQHGSNGGQEEELAPEEVELIEGLARFRNSRLGREVRDVCVQQ